MPATTEIAETPDLGIRLFDTPSASEWLTQRGVRRTPNTLRKLRCTGGGPTYRKLNGKPYYTEDDLADWIWSRLSGPIRSTSETYSTEDLENALGAGRHQIDMRASNTNARNVRATSGPDSSPRRR
jgi:hypothetical protein